MTTAPAPSFNPVTDPWIAVAHADGCAMVLSAAEALENARDVTITTPDGMLHVATVRFLRTLVTAAGFAPSSVDAYRGVLATIPGHTRTAAWAVENKHHFQVFDQAAPLFQDATLRDRARAENGVPILYLDHTAAWGRPLLSDQRHFLTETALTPPDAWKFLLVQQTWAIEGRISASDAVYGKGSNFGRGAPHCGGISYLVDGTIAQQLAWMTLPTPDPGRPWWTWQARGEPSKTGLYPAGVLPALTWHHRRMLLLPCEDGLIRHTMFAQGWYRRPQLTALTTGAALADINARTSAKTVTERVHAFHAEARQLAAETAELVSMGLLDAGVSKRVAALAEQGQDLAAAVSVDRDLAKAVGEEAKALSEETAVPVWVQPGLEDLATIDKGVRLPGAAVLAEGDYAQLLERWHSAPEGSLPYAMRTAGMAVTPPVMAVSLANKQKKILHVRSTAIPAALLTRDEAGTAAQLLVRFRFDARRAASRTTWGSAAFKLPPGFAIDLLEDEAFLSAAAPDQLGQLVRLAEEQAGRTSDPITAHVRRMALVRATNPAPEPKAAKAAKAADVDDAELFTTAEDATAATAPASADYPPEITAVISRLHGWSQSGRHRAQMSDLRHYAARPAVDNMGMNELLRDVDPDLRPAAAVVAALYAVHVQSPRARRNGSAPLPRLMRAFGSASGRGPGHVPTRAALKRITTTADVTRLLPALTSQVRYASSNAMCPNWYALLDDLSHWDRPTREQWVALFHTNLPVDSIRNNQETVK